MSKSPAYSGWFGMCLVLAALITPGIAGGSRSTVPGANGSSFQTSDPPINLALDYSTYFGAEDIRGIAIDADGNTYIAGATALPDLPTTAGALQPKFSGQLDGFVAKLNAAGDKLIYSTYLSGSVTSTPFGPDKGHSVINAISVAGDGSVYVTGATDESDFPTTAGAFQVSLKGTIDTFVARLSPDGSRLI